MGTGSSARNPRRMAAEAAVALAGWMFGAAAAMAGAADPAPASPEQSSGRKRILTEQSIWRSFVMRQGEVFRLASGEDKALDARGAPTAPPLPPANPPPPDWMKPDFDDSGWQRRKGVVLDLPADSSMLCLRGRFEVADPGAAGDLRLDMSFIGGAVVYLNGREIARRRLPAGELKPDTPADPYPDEAYLRPDGFLYANFFGDPEKFKDRLRVRYRSLSGVRLPADGLVKGVNVLAIGLYRAPASELLLTKKPAMWNRESWRGPGLYWWTRVGLESLMLSAPADAAGVVSNVGCPPGFRVWTHPVCSVVPQDAHAEAISSIRPVTMTTGRNGFAAGQIVAAAREDIRGLKAALGEFRTPDGKSRIPASAAGLLYAVPDASLKGMFNALLPAPPESVPADKAAGARQPIWITVEVPPDAAPGIYEAGLTVSATGAAPIEVPVRLRVHDWKVPDSREFTSHIGLVQSPDSVAMRYKVPMWSDRHWALMEKSFQLLGKVGNDYIWIPVMRRSHFGNEHGMVRFVRKDGAAAAGAGADSQQVTAETYAPDLSVAERYLDMAIKLQGRPEVICIYGWEAFTEGDGFEGHPNKGVPVTVWDEAAKKMEAAWAPRWGTPEGIAFWKSVLGSIREMLARRGVEGAMMFGTGTDAGPRRPEPGQTIAAACPGLPWTGRGHPNFSGFPGGARVGYTCYVWGSRPIPDPSAKRLYGWNRKPGERIVAAFPRAGSGTVGALRENAPLAAFMSASEGYHAAGEAGFGSMGADFWDVLSRDSKEINPYSRAFNVIGRYVESHYGQVYLGNSCAAVLAPGPDGAVPTVRFMAIRLGAQIAEARAFVERALLDPARKAGMSAELAERARKLLDERTRAIIRGVSSNWVEFDGFDWQDRDDRLYELCAGIARSNP